MQWVQVIEDIKFPESRPDYDFGRGFYLTPDKRIAEEWIRKEIMHDTSVSGYS